MTIKKAVYIVSFTILGILFGFLFHASLEIWYINRLVGDFEHFGLGFSFAQWFTIHRYFALVTFLGGALLGFWQGRHWWRVIYIERRYRNH